MEYYRLINCTRGIGHRHQRTSRVKIHAFRVRGSLGCSVAPSFGRSFLSAFVRILGSVYAQGGILYASRLRHGDLAFLCLLSCAELLSNHD